MEYCASSNQNSKTKICILTSVHQALDVRIFHKEAKSLARAGYNVILVAQHKNGEILDGVKIIGLSRPRNRFDRIIWTSCKILKTALEQKADIYHFHDPELMPVGIILKLLGKKVIYDVHEDLPQQILSKYYIPAWQRKPLAIFIKFVEQLASKRFDYVITATDFIREKFNKPGKVFAVRNYPILDLYKDIKADVKDASSNLKLIYTGGLTEIRGITQIIQGLEYVNNNVELILLGEFLPKEYGDKVRKLKGFGKVRCSGKVPFEDVYRYYALAHIGLVCIQPLERYKVSLPIKLFEYMATGLPVIASDFPLWKDIIDDAGCGICVDPTNPENIAGAISYLFNNPRLRKEMGINGQKAVEEKYNWEKESEKLLALYKELSAQGF